MHTPRDAHPWATGIVLGFYPWSLIITGDAHPATKSLDWFQSAELHHSRAPGPAAGAHLSATLVAVVDLQLLADDFVVQADHLITHMLRQGLPHLGAALNVCDQAPSTQHDNPCCNVAQCKAQPKSLQNMRSGKGTKYTAFL
eukprot:1156988-Pelagomonas_calceolata.AAC.5